MPPGGAPPGRGPLPRGGRARRADQQGQGADYEEYTWDQSYIYLIRDTSWQQEHWCDGQETSFELWNGGVNRGARFPDVMRVRITGGVGTGETYYFTKTLGFVVYAAAAGLEEVEARVYWHDRAYIKHGQMRICEQ